MSEEEKKKKKEREREERRSRKRGEQRGKAIAAAEGPIVDGVRAAPSKARSIQATL